MINELWEYLAVGGGTLFIVGGLAVAFLRGRRRAGEVRELPRPTPPPTITPRSPGTTPSETDERTGGVATLPRPPTAQPSGTVVAPSEPATPTRERPDAPAGRLQRLRARLARSNTLLGKGLLALLTRGGLDDAAWEEVEDTLLQADLGVEATTELVDSLRTKVKVDGTSSEADVRRWLRQDLLALVDPEMDRTIASSRVEGRPAVILVVGVNGTGKTTTVGKLARVLVAQDKDVILGAADTFRAAAADQLETWGARVGVPTVRSHKEMADPASVAFDAVVAGLEMEADVVLLDTAGRLHNKTNLMDELGKIKRVVEKRSPIDEVLLVLDATTGQNGLRQAEVFSQVVGVTGLVLTKLDGTAKGGIVVAVQRKLGVPVKLVGLGEGPDDLAPFDPVAFVDALLD